MRRRSSGTVLALIIACAGIAAFLLIRHQWQESTAPIAYVADHGQPSVVCLGDSLTAGDGADTQQSYPAWLQRQLQETGYRYRVINAGVSGNRVADGLRRLSTDVLSFHPRLVIVELGSNDPGHTPLATWEEQLDTVVATLQRHDARVIVAGLDEPGMGDAYRRVAARFGVPLVWFVTDVSRIPQDWHDLHHPNGAGYRVVMQSLWPAVRAELRGA